MTTSFIHELKIGDKVEIDRSGIIATLIGFAIYARGVQVQVAWWSNGTLIEVWMDEWRVSAHK